MFSLTSLKRRFASASVGFLASVCVFSVAFASEKTVSSEEETQHLKNYELVQSVTDEDMEALESEMDEELLADIRGALVEDKNTDILLSYLREDQEFSSVIEEYLQAGETEVMANGKQP